LVRVKNDDPAHVLPGYDYDVTDEDALLNRMQFAGSDLHTPEGLHYRALVLPTSRDLSYPALKWVKRFVEQGGAVIGLKPAGPLGMVSSQQAAEYQQIADALWTNCGESGTSAVRYGKGTIYCTADTRSALAAQGTGPDFLYRLNSGDANSGDGRAFDFVHRNTASADIYFVRNTMNKGVEATFSFRVSGHAPELWMPDDGSRTPALVYNETQDGRTEVPLAFPAYGSVFLIFERTPGVHLVDLRREGKEVYPSVDEGVGAFSAGSSAFVASEPGVYRATGSDGQIKTFHVQSGDASAVSLGPWTLSFPPGWGAPASVPVEHFGSWSESEIPGVKYFSGTAAYHATLHLSAARIEPREQVWLNLGQVREIAAVIVNGKRVQTLWREPFAVRIDGGLHAGDNTVEIQVTNLWPNRIIGDMQPSATNIYTHTNVHAYTKDSPLLPSGLIEPVTVQVDAVQSLQ
jgi:hypothetical protein